MDLNHTSRPGAGSQPAADDLTNLLAGREIEVGYLDGRRETVRVRKLPIRAYDRYLTLYQGDEAGCVEMYCDRPAGWAETLDDASYEAVVTTGEELNGERFLGWFRRRMERQSNLIPGFQKKVDDLMARASAVADAAVERGTPPPAAPSASDSSALPSPSGPA